MRCIVWNRTANVPILLGSTGGAGGLLLNYYKWPDNEPVDGYMFVAPSYKSVLCAVALSPPLLPRRVMASCPPCAVRRVLIGAAIGASSDPNSEYVRPEARQFFLRQSVVNIRVGRMLANRMTGGLAYKVRSMHSCRLILSMLSMSATSWRY